MLFTSYGSWKTWKAMEFKNFIFQTRKVMETCNYKINGKLIMVLSSNNKMN